METIEEQKKFESADFHKTFARPEYRKTNRLIHRNVENAGEHNQFSQERKHPVFYVGLPIQNVSINLNLLPSFI